MARTPKPPKPIDPAKALRKLLKILRGYDEEAQATLLADLTALLDASPDAITSVDSLQMLAYAAEKPNLPVFELLFARGADPTRKIGDDGSPCLADLIAIRSDDPARIDALAAQMVARGADPNERSGRTSPLERAAGNSLPAVETILRLGADQAAALAALHVAVPNAVRDPAKLPIVTRLLAHLASVDAPGPEGLSALHIVALRGTPALLEPVLAASHHPAHPIAVAQHFNTDHCSPPGGGLVPQILLAVGFTARDAVAALHEVYDAAVAWYGDAGFGADQRLQRRDQLAAVHELLATRGVPHGTPERGELAPFVAEVDALLTRLATHVGGDPNAVLRTAAAVPIEGVGPWSYSSVVLERARTPLLRGAVADHVGDSWLAHLVSGEHRKFLVAHQKQYGWNKPDLTAYAEEARRPLELGQIVGGRGDALLIVWRHAEGVARVGVAAPARFELLGDDILDFLRRELKALDVAVDDIPTSNSVGPGGLAPKLLRADYDTPPAATDINRIGGRPIGIAEWPLYDGAPMHHVLTIDLDDHPDFQPPGARALAFFISSPSQHEAYAPHNPHTRILLLTDADLARGETPLPAALADADDLIRPASLRLETTAGLTRSELYQHSFAGGFPIWLQGDETEDMFGDGDDDDDYDDDGDSDDDDDYDSDGESDDSDGPRERRLPPPRSFVLQFDGSLIPDVNLGDLGIMYVFAETAWFQCH